MKGCLRVEITMAPRECDDFPEISRIFTHPAGFGAKWPGIGVSTAAPAARQGRAHDDLHQPAPAAMGRTGRAAVRDREGLAWRAGGARRRVLAGGGRPPVVVHRASPRAGGSAPAGTARRFPGGVVETRRRGASSSRIRRAGATSSSTSRPTAHGGPVSSRRPASGPRSATSRCRKSRPSRTWRRTAHGSRRWPFRWTCSEARLDFGPQSRANVTFVLNSPEQRFLTAADSGGGEPDFHRPERFPQLVFREMPPAGQ